MWFHEVYIFDFINIFDNSQTTQPYLTLPSCKNIHWHKKKLIGLKQKQNKRPINWYLLQKKKKLGIVQIPTGKFSIWLNEVYIFDFINIFNHSQTFLTLSNFT